MFLESVYSVRTGYERGTGVSSHESQPGLQLRRIKAAVSNRGAQTQGQGRSAGAWTPGSEAGGLGPGPLGLRQEGWDLEPWVWWRRGWDPAYWV
jgi:hypothetical protein